MLGEKDLIYLGAVLLYQETGNFNMSVKNAKLLYKEIFEDEEDKDNMICE